MNHSARRIKPYGKWAKEKEKGAILLDQVSKPGAKLGHKPMQLSPHATAAGQNWRVGWLKSGQDACCGQPASAFTIVSYSRAEDRADEKRNYVRILKAVRVLLLTCLYVSAE